MDNYWDWLSTSFVPKIRASPWYNGDPPANLSGTLVHWPTAFDLVPLSLSSGYIGDRANRILGWGTMRQLRVEAGLLLLDHL